LCGEENGEKNKESLSYFTFYNQEHNYNRKKTKIQKNTSMWKCFFVAVRVGCNLNEAGGEAGGEEAQ
jgi:hypothetical protein